MLNKKKGNKKFIAFLAVIVFIILLGGIFSALVFSNSSYSIPETKVSSNLIDKVRVSQNQGSVLELNKDELNQIIGMYFKKDKSFAGVNIKGVYGDFVGTNLKLYIPASYKGFNLLITSEGSLAYKNDKIEYRPLYFKVGKVTLPKTFILDKLQSHFQGTISLEDGAIAVNKDLIPIKINSIEINNNKVLIGMVKGVYILEEKVKSIEREISKNISKSQTLKENVVKDSSPNAENSLDSSSNYPSTSKNTSEMDTALNRISGSLSSAMASVSSGSQKAVISEVISAVNSMQGNPSANPYSAGASAKAAYKALSPQEKAELKSAIFSNINGSDINTVSKILGK